jgi:hypothetical protein
MLRLGATAGWSVSLTASHIRRSRCDESLLDWLIARDDRRIERGPTSALRLSGHFARLRPEQLPVVNEASQAKSTPTRGHAQARQAGAIAALQQVDVDLQQPVLDEWAPRCQTSTARNPAGYLFWRIQKTMRGESRAWPSGHAGGTPQLAAVSAPEQPPR